MEGRTHQAPSGMEASRQGLKKAERLNSRDADREANETTAIAGAKRCTRRSQSGDQREASKSWPRNSATASPRRPKSPPAEANQATPSNSSGAEPALPTAAAGRYVASADRPPPWTTLATRTESQAKQSPTGQNAHGACKTGPDKPRPHLTLARPPEARLTAFRDPGRGRRRLGPAGTSLLKAVFKGGGEPQKLPWGHAVLAQESGGLLGEAVAAGPVGLRSA
jgi:hypothetical protein